MKKATVYIAAIFLMMATTLRAQTSSNQTKDKSTEKQGAEVGNTGKQSRGSGSASVTSEATIGIPPTHIDKTNSVPAASNPQNAGVNAINRKKAGSTVQGGLKKDSNAVKQPSSEKSSQEKNKHP